MHNEGNKDESEECFFLFLEEFGPIASGYNNFNRYKKQIVMFQDCCTPSDEALVIFFLSVNWDSWVQEIETSSSDHPRKRKLVSNKKYSGWNSDDLLKFNKFCRLVGTARATPLRKELEEKFKTRNKYHCMINEIEPAHSDETSNIESPSSVVPYTDLLAHVVTPNNLSQNEEFDSAQDVAETEDMDETQFSVELLLEDTTPQHVAV